ncbi:MAG: cytochrome P460 family protein [Micavibrio sp.]|nr:cytochrome P460 family protein [Micavibrio sp.]
MKSFSPAAVFSAAFALTLAVSISAATLTHAEKEPGAVPAQKAPEDLADQDSMNGYALADFADFQKNWHFVTVRYRKDTSEMRLTYANDIAWAALNAKSTDYPDGAVFAKIGILTAEDPAFTSSAVPSGARRFQLMVRDKKKFADTNGWGYALFDAHGKASGKDVDIRSRACDACHALVPERGYVFSEPMRLDVAENPEVPQAITPIAGNMVFETVAIAALPKALQEKLPKGAPQVRQLRGSLEKNIFRGTVDEIRPTLAAEARRTDMPAVLASTDGTLFSLMYLDGAACAGPDGKPGVTIKGFYTTGEVPGKTSNIVPTTYCAPKE